MSREAGWFKKGQDTRRRRGRRRGTRDRVPRSKKASLLQVLGELEEHHAEDNETALLDGVHAKPPVSSPTSSSSSLTAWASRSSASKCQTPADRDSHPRRPWPN